MRVFRYKFFVLLQLLWNILQISRVCAMGNNSCLVECLPDLENRTAHLRPGRVELSNSGSQEGRTGDPPRVEIPDTSYPRDSYCNVQCLTEHAHGTGNSRKSEIYQLP